MIINEGGICEPGGELGPPMVKIVQEHFWKVWSKQIISCQSVAIFKACKLVVFGLCVLVRLLSGKVIQNCEYLSHFLSVKAIHS